MSTVETRTPERGSAARGFTLIEVCWAMAIFGTMAAVAVSSLHGWMGGTQQTATTSSVEALLRETQQRAVTEGRAMCVSFDLPAQSWSVFRGTCDSAGQVRLNGPIRPEGSARIPSASFKTGTSTLPAVTFYPRGTASPGTLTITRPGSGRVDTLTVEGLTGRVSRG